MILFKRLFLPLAAILVNACAQTQDSSINFNDPRVNSLSEQQVRIFSGGHLLTMTDSSAEAMAVQMGKILALGAPDQLSQQYQGAQQINLMGNTLMPGLIETHTHLMLTATQKQWTELGPLAYKSVETMREAFKLITPNEQGRIQGIGWEVGSLELSIKEMDDIYPDNPVLVVQRGHGIWANTKAFEAAGLDRNSIAPEGSQYIKDSDGNLTGYISGQSGVFKMLGGSYPSASVKNTLETAQEAAALGFTTFADIGISNPTDFSTLIKAVESETFPVRVVGALMESYPNLEQSLTQLKNYKTEKMTFLGLKTWMDGATQGGNIDTHLHYRVPSFNKTKGPWRSQENSNALALLALQAGTGFVFHANGEQGLLSGLTAVEYALDQADQLDLNIDNFSRQAIHVSLATDSAFKKMRQLDVQPTFLLGHLYYNGDRYLDELFGDVVHEYAFRLKSAFDAGLKPSMHNDSPVTPTTPFLMMETAISRKTQSGRTLAPQETISIDQALAAYTRNAAIHFDMDDKVGTLEAGKEADFIIIDRNPLTTEVEELSEIQVLTSVMNGRTTYQRQ